MKPPRLTIEERCARLEAAAALTASVIDGADAGRSLEELVERLLYPENFEPSLAVRMRGASAAARIDAARE